MVVDRFSPVAPARIRVLALPMGKIKRSRFSAFVDRLNANSVVRLGDITPDGRSDRPMFSPLAFPNGMLLYEVSTSAPSAAHLALAPFEQYREPFVILGIADCEEYPSFSSVDGVNGEQGTSAAHDIEEDFALFEDHLIDLRERYHRALVHACFFFDCTRPLPKSGLIEGFIPIPPQQQSRATTLKTIMCDVSSLLLAELTTLAKSLQALPSIASPTISKFPANGGIDGHWSPEPSIGLVRSNTGLRSATRSVSPTGPGVAANRMSMPVLPSSGSPYLGSQPTSPTDRSGTPPSKTYEDFGGSGPSSASSSPGPINKAIPRDSSRDRVSVHGFGSGSIDERNRKKGKGRVGIVIGTLYLQAGRWHDALRELQENTSKARDVGDHVWHAKGLECMLIALVLLSWTGSDFQIPQLCLPFLDRSSSKSNSSTPGSSSVDVSQTTSPPALSGIASKQALVAAIPDLVNIILNIYSRSSSYSKDSVPQLVLSETTIRFSKLMATMNLAGGTLNEDCFKFFVNGELAETKPTYGVPRQSISPTKLEVAGLLLKAMTWSSENSNLSLPDMVSVLAGVASAFSLLDLRRKNAIVMRELMSLLLPALLQVRKIAAAEQGIHPLASLTSTGLSNGAMSGWRPSTSETDTSLIAMLTTVGHIYGLPNLKSALPSLSKQPPAAPSTTEGADDSIPEGSLGNPYFDTCGGLEIKLDFLQLCIDICDALREPSGTLAFTAAMLRVCASRPESEPGSDTVVRMEKTHQERLMTNFARTVYSVSKSSVSHIETEYWDPYLVRSIEAAGHSSLMTLTSHRKSIIKAGVAGGEIRSGPFIHNPFLKKPGKAESRLLVAGEEQGFVITLQNPYEFNVEVQSLSLITDGIPIKSHLNHILLGPSRTQQFLLVGVPESHGTIKITGCRIKILGCKERIFPVHLDALRVEPEVKMRGIGLSSFRPRVSRPLSGVSVVSKAATVVDPTSLDFKIIPPQPSLTVAHTTLAESALMVLEGQVATFSVTLRNTSKIPVDLVRVSFEDSATAALQNAITNKDISQAELFEIESQLKHFPIMRLDGQVPKKIDPGQRAQLTFKVLGKPGLSDASVQVDYASLSSLENETGDEFYTRKVTIPITVTVNASIQLQRADVIPFPSDFAWSTQKQQTEERRRSASIGQKNVSNLSSPVANYRFKSLLSSIGARGNQTDHCLVLLDLRNSWPMPLGVSLEVKDQSDPSIPENEWRKAYTVHELIQPGHIARLVLLLPRIHLKNPHARIPSVDPAKERQFVVSATRFSPEAERASRESFWYREQLLKLLRGTWEEENGTRRGDLDLRNIRLSQRMIDAFKIEDLRIDMRILPHEEEDVQQTGRSRFTVPEHALLTLRTKVENRSEGPVHAVLRLQPLLANQAQDHVLDLDRRITWSGLLQRALPVIAPGESVETDLGICVLSSGAYEVGAMVEEIQGVDEEAAKAIMKSRARSVSALDALPPMTTRRIWCADNKCVIVAARERDDDLD